MGLFNNEGGVSKWGIILKGLFGAAMIVGAPFAIYFSVKNAISAQASNSWPQVQAKVTRFQVTSSHRKYHTDYSPSVEYQFSVNGSTYTGKRFTFGSNPTERSQLDVEQEYGTTYRIGSEIPVYYDPVNPNESVIQKGSGISVYLFVLIGPALLIFGSLALWVQYQEYQNLPGARPSKKKSKKSKSPTKMRRPRRPMADDDE